MLSSLRLRITLLTYFPRIKFALRGALTTVVNLFPWLIQHTIQLPIAKSLNSLTENELFAMFQRESCSIISWGGSLRWEYVERLQCVQNCYFSYAQCCYPFHSTLVFTRESIAKRFTFLQRDFFTAFVFALWKWLRFSVKRIIKSFAIKAMPNLINRRKKKNKVLEIVVNDNSCDSDSSEYDFSSKLNCKYNVFPEELSKQSRAVAKDDKDNAKSIRFDSSDWFQLRVKGCIA